MHVSDDSETGNSDGGATSGRGGALTHTAPLPRRTTGSFTARWSPSTRCVIAELRMSTTLSSDAASGVAIRIVEPYPSVSGAVPTVGRWPANRYGGS